MLRFCLSNYCLNCILPQSVRATSAWGLGCGSRGSCCIRVRRMKTCIALQVWGETHSWQEETCHWMFWEQLVAQAGIQKSEIRRRLFCADPYETWCVTLLLSKRFNQDSNIWSYLTRKCVKSQRNANRNIAGSFKKILADFLSFFKNIFIVTKITSWCQNLIGTFFLKWHILVTLISHCE